MSKAEIYYFSGTGNSCAVARDIAQRIGAKLTPIGRLTNESTISTEASVVGFVFPVYDFKPPKIVSSFIPRLTGIGSKYLFAVATYGLAPSQSLQHLGRTMKACGGELAGGFAVGMPHNGIGCGAVPKGEYEKMFRNWETKLADVTQYICERRRGKIESSSLLFTLSQPGFVKMLPSVIRFLGILLFRGIGSLSLTYNGDCIGCGTCKRICPVSNIEIVEKRPTWQKNCTGCLACLHWCPQGAINIGRVDLNIRRYHHPEVNLSDMV